MSAPSAPVTVEKLLRSLPRGHFSNLGDEEVNAYSDALRSHIESTGETGPAMQHAVEVLTNFSSLKLRSSLPSARKEGVVFGKEKSIKEMMHEVRAVMEKTLPSDVLVEIGQIVAAAICQKRRDVLDGYYEKVQELLDRYDEESRKAYIMHWQLIITRDVVTQMLGTLPMEVTFEGHSAAWRRVSKSIGEALAALSSPGDRRRVIRQLFDESIEYFELVGGYKGVTEEVKAYADESIACFRTNWSRMLDTERGYEVPALIVRLKDMTSLEDFVVQINDMLRSTEEIHHVNVARGGVEDGVHNLFVLTEVLTKFRESIQLTGARFVDEFVRNVCVAANSHEMATNYVEMKDEFLKRMGSALTQVGVAVEQFRSGTSLGISVETCWEPLFRRPFAVHAAERAPEYFQVTGYVPPPTADADGFVPI